MAAISLEALRERIRALEGARIRAERIPSGVEEVDRLIRGLPVPGIVEVSGAPGSGRTHVAARLASSWISKRRAVAWVDFGRCLYPPGLEPLGIDPSWLLVVRPPADLGGWATEQLLRSACFPMVVASEPAVLGRSGPRWARAAEAGRCTALVISRRPLRQLPAAVRLVVDRGELVLVRDRGGLGGAVTELSAGWAQRAAP